ncbi:glycosyltransferase [Helicobacter sp. 11S02596-1]|uniref:glycosyltransferase n=1 Tax=Helicobacter sp. 11S02596-1 TaxID=1476194 RepID=UPI000BA5B687|nr:glycosyltransferase [Helicobacter sp. 11S02596-1]PAF45200.1 hypothetical protein BJI48_01160 [Helicobacter sp. 11S02596-1]
MSPKISIIIPVYNVAPFITRCLDSCIHQTLTDIEIIIVDDCGSDDSIKIATEYASKDNRIKIISNPQNLGTFHARIIGANNANGLYCMFVDGDDFLHPGACEIAFRAISKQKVDILALRMQHFPKTFLRINPRNHQGKLIEDSLRQYLSKSPNAQSLCDKIILTQILKNASKALNFVQKPLRFFEDGLLLLVGSFFAKSYFGQKDFIYFYCHNAQSVSRTHTQESLKQKYANLKYILEILEELKKAFPSYGVFIDNFAKKTASALILEARFFDKEAFLQAYKILKKHHFTKKPPKGDSYIQAVGLSLRYHFRWQNLIRLFAYLLGFKKIDNFIINQSDVMHFSPQASAKTLAPTNINKIKIAYVGEFQEEKYVKKLLEIVGENQVLELHIGGFGILENIIKTYAKKHSNIIFYDKNPYAKTLKIQQNCDIFLTLFDPTSPNHYFAMPNKIYQTPSLSKPILVLNPYDEQFISQKIVAVLQDYLASKNTAGGGGYRLKDTTRPLTALIATAPINRPDYKPFSKSLCKPTLKDPQGHARVA